jgi:hypothetical protein
VKTHSVLTLAHQYRVILPTSPITPINTTPTELRILLAGATGCSKIKSNIIAFYPRHAARQIGLSGFEAVAPLLIATLERVRGLIRQAQ